MHLTINYRQTAFTLPWRENTQELHEQIYDTLLQGQHVPGENKRTFLFDVAGAVQGKSYLLATARSTEFEDSIPSVHKQLVVEPGMELKVRIRVAAVYKRYREGKNNRYEAVPSAEIADWFASLLSRHGMKVTHSDLLSYSILPVRKAKQAFDIPAARLEASVTVENVELFTNAFLNGVGRNKGYGLGMIELVSE